jgi:hypothetical protein
MLTAECNSGVSEMMGARRDKPKVGHGYNRGYRKVNNNNNNNHHHHPKPKSPKARTALPKP